MPQINRNPDATNSELDAKQIVTNKELNPSQRSKLIEQYVELVVDNMDVKSMMQFITEELEIRYRNDYTDEELREEVNNYDDELYEELVDNITDDKELTTQEQIDYVNSNLTSESYVDSLLTSGTDYPPLVDTEATHDSEGC